MKKITLLLFAVDAFRFVSCVETTTPEPDYYFLATGRRMPPKRGLEAKVDGLEPFADEKWPGFSYLSASEEALHSHSEHRDANNRVRGEYSIYADDGQKRTVVYEADENGFRAKVYTNEAGTESKNPADVIFESEAPMAEYLSNNYEKFKNAPSGKGALSLLKRLEKHRRTG